MQLMHNSLDKNLQTKPPKSNLKPEFSSDNSNEIIIAFYASNPLTNRDALPGPGMLISKQIFQSKWLF